MSWCSCDSPRVQAIYIHVTKLCLSIQANTCEHQYCTSACILLSLFGNLNKSISHPIGRSSRKRRADGVSEVQTDPNRSKYAKRSILDCNPSEISRNEPRSWTEKSEINRTFDQPLKDMHWCTSCLGLRFRMVAY